jgi:hypothetical protein
VGGRGTLIGPIVGAVAVNALKSWATTNIPDLWLILLGGLFVLVVLFLPKGLVGILGQVRAWWAARRAASKGDGPPPRPRKPGRVSHEHGQGVYPRGRGGEQIVRRVQGDLRPELLHGSRRLRVVIGPNGAGKSTFLDLITGRTRPDSGTITFGHDAVDLTTLGVTQIHGLGDRAKVPDALRLHRSHGL